MMEQIPALDADAIEASLRGGAVAELENVADVALGVEHRVQGYLADLYSPSPGVD
jgi:hypothetical protein